MDKGCRCRVTTSPINSLTAREFVMLLLRLKCFVCRHTVQSQHSIPERVVLVLFLGCDRFTLRYCSYDTGVRQHDVNSYNNHFILNSCECVLHPCCIKQICVPRVTSRLQPSVLWLGTGMYIKWFDRRCLEFCWFWYCYARWTRAHRRLAKPSEGSAPAISVLATLSCGK